MKYLLYFISITLFASCNKPAIENGITYFGGQIINPKGDKVFLYKDDKLIDSSKLDIHRKFLMTIDTLATGLYTFKHGPEMQYIYLEPKDSLLLRLNTWDFDESLVFSGKGAERNNFLINLFLINEKEDKMFLKYYSLNDSLFQKKIDSTLLRKNNLYQQFKEEVTINSPLFDKLVNTAIYYPLYRQKEAYPFRHKWALNADDYPHTEPSFYKYRRDVNLNDNDLSQFYAYLNYIESYLYHIAYEKQVIDNFKSSLYVNFIKAAIDNLKDSPLRDKFVFEGTLYAMLDENSSINDKELAQQLFFDNNKNPENNKEIKHLITASKGLAVGKKLPQINLISYKSNKENLDDLIKNKNTVIYTWPTGMNQIENLAKRINYLEKKYPEYTFVGINCKNPENKWKQYITSQKINPDYQFKTDSIVNWLDVNFSRAILINKNGIVQNNLTHLNSRRFEKQLKKLKNQ